jgi:hypothetical protein
MKTLLAFALIVSASVAVAGQPYRSALEGKWIQRDTRLVLDIASTSDGTTFTYSVQSPGMKGSTDRLSFVTQFDGTDAAMLVNGAPTGQTIALTILDDRHASGITKFQGKTTGASKSELSDDGKVLRVDNDVAAPGAASVHRLEVWDKQ